MNSIFGQWTTYGTAFAPDGSLLYEFDSNMEISGCEAAPRIVTTTRGGKSSRSLSYAEKLQRTPEGKWVLRYGYEADPEDPASKDHEFFGLAQLLFTADGSSATGSSCNYNGRYVVVELELKRD